MTRWIVQDGLGVFATRGKTRYAVISIVNFDGEITQYVLRRSELNGGSWDVIFKQIILDSNQVSKVDLAVIEDALSHLRTAKAAEQLIDSFERWSTRTTSSATQFNLTGPNGHGYKVSVSGRMPAGEKKRIADAAVAAAAMVAVAALALAKGQAVLKHLFPKSITLAPLLDNNSTFDQFAGQVRTTDQALKLRQITIEYVAAVDQPPLEKTYPLIKENGAYTERSAFTPTTTGVFGLGTETAGDPIYVYETELRHGLDDAVKTLLHEYGRRWGSHFDIGTGNVLTDVTMWNRILEFLNLNHVQTAISTGVPPKTD